MHASRDLFAGRPSGGGGDVHNDRRSRPFGPGLVRTHAVARRSVRFAARSACKRVTRARIRHGRTHRDDTVFTCAQVIVLADTSFKDKRLARGGSALHQHAVEDANCNLPAHYGRGRIRGGGSRLNHCGDVAGKSPLRRLFVLDTNFCTRSRPLHALPEFPVQENPSLVP